MTTMIDKKDMIAFDFKYLFVCLAIQFMGCDSNSQPSEIKPNNPEIQYLEVVSGLTNPWGMAFHPNGDILVTEKEGSIKIVRAGEVLSEEIKGLPEIFVRGQGGLLDIELHPEFEKNHWVYLSYGSEDGPGNGGNTTISRFVLEDNTLKDPKVLYKASPNSTHGNHWGSRLAFDSKGYLYFTIGDRGARNKNPQDLNRDGGKVYRIKDDGTIPEDNPFYGQSGAKQAVYSYGHRNPQGLAIDLTNDFIWEHEHGPQGGDEINLIKPGKNYGWPIISYGINYDGTSFAEDTVRAGMENPVIYWVPSIAPCGMTVVTGSKYPGWEGDLIIGSLKFSYLVHAKVKAGKIVSQEKIAEGIGRVRNVEQGPDGFLYVGVEAKGLYRLIMK
jgi:glucose/arabinose dehydrogenase